MELEMPEGVTLKTSPAPGKWYIMHAGERIGSLAEWPKSFAGDCGSDWESRGVGFVMLGEYDTAQEALDASLRDSGLLVEHVSTPHESGRLLDCRACEATCHCGPGVADGREAACVWDGHEPEPDYAAERAAEEYGRREFVE